MRQKKKGELQKYDKNSFVVILNEEVGWFFFTRRSLNGILQRCGLSGILGTLRGRRKLLEI